ncbi:MAG: curli production assembly/transport component CsgF [Bacteroidota bacterium]
MRLLLLGAALLVAAPAGAQQLVYTPTNPAFGGSPLNYNWLLSSAQAQNDLEDDTANRFQRDPLADFETSLQRQILNQLSRELVFNRFRDLDLSQPGQFDLGDFQVEIIPGFDGISVRIFNLLTGDETVVTVPNAP